jgi:phosphinothricin acetyltransferase
VAEGARPAPPRDRRRGNGRTRPRGTRYNNRLGQPQPVQPARAYRHVADFSIYVARSHRGKGAGKALLARLVELAREHGYHKLVLSAFPFNAAGMALYEKLGFRTVGTYEEQGLLDGRWVDTIVMEKLL